jgi:hypothetical protein
MNKTLYRIAILIMTLVMILGNTIPTQAQAAGNVYYVSPTGSDTNPGTASAPFKTLATGISKLNAGDTLNIYAGVYNEQLKITKSGTSTAGITIQGLSGKIIIDMKGTSAVGLDVRGSYITVNNLIVRNSRETCVNLTGSNITVRSLVVHECGSHGIQANNASNINILNNGVFRTVLSNEARTASGGWGSAIKVRESTNVLIQGNIVYNNYGEGIGTRGTNVTIRANTVYDNFSVNIYTNSENALIERNLVYCNANSGFERNGQPAAGISMGEEYYAGWGARLKNARILNNIVAFCKHGVRYNGAESGVSGGGLKNAIIAHNTLYGSTNSALSIVYESAQSGSLIANNIIWQAENKLVAIDNPTGLTFQNNLWKVQPPAAFRSPGDQIGDPQISADPIYQPESYRPGNIALAGGTAANINISHDFFERPRGTSFDMGAIQFGGGSGWPGSAETPTPAATLLPETPQATSTAVNPANTVIVPTATRQATQAPDLPEITYDNKDSAFVYSDGWKEEVKAAAFGGSYAQTSRNGSSVTFPFTGQSFSIIYKGGPSYRDMEVYIDGTRVGTINQRHDQSTYKARWDYSGQLAPGPHTLKLVFAGEKSTNLGSIDAVIVRGGQAQPVPTATAQPTQPSPPTSQETVYDNKDSAFEFSSGWQEEVKRAAWGGSYTYTSQSGASVSLPFTGRSFSIIYKGGPSYRDMEVYIDGTLVGTINQRHDQSTYQARWDYPGELPAGPHTLKLVFVAAKSTNLGSIDAVIVR